MSAVAARERLYLFTDGYPWGPGEKPFVAPEIEALRARYDVTVVSLAPDELIDVEELVSELPKDVGLIRWQRHSRARRAVWALSMPFTAAGRAELRDLMRDGFRLARLRDSLLLYSGAKSLQEHCRSVGVFSGDSSALFYGFWFSIQCLALALEKGESRDAKVICRVHGYDLYNERNPNGRQAWQRFMRDACDKVLFLDEKALEYFTSEFGPECFTGQYAVNGLGVAAANPSPGLCAGERPRVVSCSNMIALKRVDLVATALGELPSGSVEWVHFGGGPERDRIESMASTLGLEARFAGCVSNAEVREYYERNHVEAFVTATSSEGVPVSVMEALAAGIPIVAPDVGGISGQVDGNGVLLPTDPTPAEFADAVAKVCFASDGEKERMRRRSLEIWAEKYDVGKNKAELIRITESV